MGDQRDRPGGQRVGLHVADRAQPAGHVDEAHAARAAHRHPGGAGDGGQPLAQAGWPAGRGPGGSCALPKMTADRSPRRAASVSCSSSAASGTASSTRSTGSGQVGQRREARAARDLAVPRVDQVHPRRGAAPRHLGDHPLAEAAVPRAGPDQGHAARLQHRDRVRPSGPVRGCGPGPAARSQRSARRLFASFVRPVPVSSRFLAHHPGVKSRPGGSPPDALGAAGRPRPPGSLRRGRAGGGGVRDGVRLVLALGWMGVVMTAG